MENAILLATETGARAIVLVESETVLIDIARMAGTLEIMAERSMPTIKKSGGEFAPILNVISVLMESSYYTPDSRDKSFETCKGLMEFGDHILKSFRNIAKSTNNAVH